MKEPSHPAARPGATWPLYDPEPDYTRPGLQVPHRKAQRLKEHLAFLYGPRAARQWLPELLRLIRVHHAHKNRRVLQAEADFDPAERLTQRDLVLITYGDQLRNPGETPLSTLVRVCDSEALFINTLHILPFFPYSSDRGFAVVDFQRVDPRLGDWGDIRRLAGNYKLMFDGVLNHASSHSKAFKEFLNAHPRYRDFFISYTSPDELTPAQRKLIFRPRTSDILTRFETLEGPRWVWTTFSPDQIDFNFHNPAVLMDVVEALLFYVRQGADFLRLDAVTYLWAEPGTPSVNLPQTHEVVKLLRSVFELAAPQVVLLTETNVPHQENVSYFGDGHDEAHMVYNFALPPLVLHAFHRQDATVLTRWAAGLEPPSDRTAFFNILDTHDGIGLMGAKDILPPEEIDFLVKEIQARGGLVSYKSTGDGDEEPYELNSTWWSALDSNDPGEDLEFKVRRYLASRSIALVLKGVPGVYLLGTLGAANDHEAVRRSGVKRDINRTTLELAELEVQLMTPGSKLSALAPGFRRLNQVRTSHRAFHPRGEQKVLEVSPRVFAVLRSSPEGDAHLLCLTNLSPRPCRVQAQAPQCGIRPRAFHDLLADQGHPCRGESFNLELAPYQVAWLEPRG